MGIWVDKVMNDAYSSCVLNTPGILYDKTNKVMSQHQNSQVLSMKGLWNSSLQKKKKSIISLELLVE